MNKSARTIILFLGAIAVIIVIYKVVSGYSKTQGEQQQKKAYMEGLVAQEVWCETCGETSPMEVMYNRASEFQVCPKCGQKKARAIVYFMCGNPECNRQLISVRNNIFENNEYLPSPDAIACPKCGRRDTVMGDTMHLNRAKQIAEETGQPFP